MLLFKRYDYNPKTDLIGKGGFSRVYKALDKKLNRFVALKVYKANELSERYSPIAEIQRVIGLDHPNISRYIDIEEIEEEDSFGQVEKIQVCVMELLEGGNLATYYNLQKNLEIFTKLLIDVLHGLAYLHGNGIIHRDIKPANILIRQNPDGPVAKITDFGISKRSDAIGNSSSSGLIVSVPYMAPEQLNAQKYGIDEKIHFNIDLWSLGVTVYEIISGDVLFKNHAHDSSEQIMTNIISLEPPQKIQNLPSPFKEFVSKCLIKDAKQRVKTADELLALLTSISPQSKVNAVKDKGKQNMQPGSTGSNKQKETENISADETRILPAGLANSFEKNFDTTSDDTRILPAASTNIPEKNNDTQPGDTDQANDTRLIEKKEADPFETRLISENKEAPPKNIPPKPATDDTVQLEKSESGKERSKVTLFNRYDYYPLNDLIGKGGFSRVYKANDQKLSRWVALKIYKTSEFSDRYSPIAEIKRVVNLDHPNICRYLDIEEIEKLNPFGEIEKIQVCVMELLDSGNFLEYFNNNGRDLETLKKLLQDVIHGIAYLHKNGIIHRDIKPANILIKKTIEGPVAKITDFGISKVSDSVNNNSSSALIVSIPYMAPEQLNVKKYGINEKIGFNLDLWSLGVTVYEVITGNVLFKNSEQDSSEQIMANIMAPELPEKIKELPQPFRNIVSHCIVKNANERAQKAEELLVLLNSSLPDELPAPEPEPMPAIENEPLVTAPLAAQPEVEIKKPEPFVPLPEKQEEPVLKRKFSIAEAAPVVEQRAKKHINLLKIFIIAATVILIVTCILYYNLKDEKSTGDTASITDSLVNKQADTAKKITNDTATTVIVPAAINQDSIDQKAEELKKKLEALKKEKEAKNKKDSIAATNKRSDTKEKIAVNFVATKACTITGGPNGNKMEFSGTGRDKQQDPNVMEGTYTYTITYRDGSKKNVSITISKNRRGSNGIQPVTFQ